MSEVPEMFDVAELRAALPLLDPPPDVLRRWHAALDQLPPPAAATPRTAHAAADSHAPARAYSATAKHRLAPSRPAGRGGDAWRPDRRRALGAGILAAAAAVLALLAPSVPTRPADTPVAPAPLTLSQGDLSDVGWTLLSAQPIAPGDQAQLAGCLARLGAKGATALGSRRVVLDGRPGVLLVLATPTPGQIRTLVVTLDCGPDRGAALADRTSGR
ncbi:MAG: hypothetical protein J2P19_29425 [Pseudonocardia sp.]|nr:hypothetical protein [Pseudonocardia sp.]